jgi:sulfite reductase beta subunit-like hemoprotein
MNVRKRDWFRILRDLKAVGVSYHAVARRCNRNPTTVQAWAEGVEPKESDARVVLALYAKHLPEAYIVHQREFAIRVDDVTDAGETPRLAFVEVR